MRSWFVDEMGEYVCFKVNPLYEYNIDIDCFLDYGLQHWLTHLRTKKWSTDNVEFGLMDIYERLKLDSNRKVKQNVKDK